MKLKYFNPLIWLGAIILTIGMGISYAIGSWIFCPFLSAMERAPKSPGMPTPIFIILFIVISPILLLLSLETLPDRIRQTAEARAASAN